MIRIFQLPQYAQIKTPSLYDLENFQSLKKNIAWIDLQDPSQAQIKEIEEFYNINFPTRQQQEEIEISSRYLENSGIIKINSTFVNIIPNNSKLEEHEISFIITEQTLFTLRYFDSRVISETVKKIKQFPTIFINPAKIFIAILEARTDFDADLIELISRFVADISRKITFDRKLDEKVLLKINDTQDLTMSLREALFDKQRTLSSLLRNEDLMLDSSHRLLIIIKDINSLIEHANFNFTRLEYLQNSFLGLLNIEQNKVIKTFTVVSLVFMPPTLIASIYGMNFKMFPELDLTWGYPLALLLMLVSSVIPLAIFRHKKLL
jgi:magnesium transporter